MLTRLYADNDEELVFSSDIPPELKAIGFPSHLALAATMQAGYVLWLEIPCNGISVRLQYYLLHKSCRVTLVANKPELRLPFVLSNHVHYSPGSLGSALFYEHGYNVLYLHDPVSTWHFHKEGLYSFMEIIYPENTFLKLQSSFPVMRNFLKRVQRQHDAWLMPVNQIGSRPLTELVYKLVQTLHRNSDTHWLRNRCVEVLAQCLTDVSAQPRLEPVNLAPEDAPAIYHARTLLVEQYRQNWTMKKLGALTGLNHYKLENGFWQLYQQSPSDYLRAVRMEKAWALLPGNRHSVTQVAELVGYTNLSAFSKAFKKHFNMTARQRTKDNE
jgi:AraC-like DNA-binding protein